MRQQVFLINFSAAVDPWRLRGSPHAAPLIFQVNGEETGETLSAYSSSPETVFGAAYLAILPTHRLLRGNSSVRPVLENAFKPGRGE